MTQETERSTPPKQTPNDANTADRRLSDEQKQNLTNEPAPPTGAGKALPKPTDVGEDG